MSLTLDANLRPKPVNLAGSSVPFVLATNNLYSDVGTKAVFDLQVIGLPAANDTLNIEWNSGASAVQFRFAPSVDDSGTQIQDGSGYGNISSWIDLAAIPALEANAFVSADYVITRQGTDRIRFTAKSKGTAFALVFDGSEAGDWSAAQITAGENEVKRPNFKVVALVNVRQSGQTDYTEIALELDPINSQAAFDLGPVLEGDWYEDPLPSASLNQPTIFTSCIAEFYVRYAEQFGNDRITQRLSETNVYRSLHGGLSYDDARAQDVHTTYIVANKFLNRLPQNAELFTGQLVYLWWYALGEAAADADIQVSFVYEDGTTSGGAIKLFDITDVADHRLICIPVSITQVLLVADPKPVYSFEIWVSANGFHNTHYTEKRKFILSDRTVLDVLDLAYINGFGLVETFRCLGEVQRHTSAQHTFGQKPIDPRSTDPLSVHQSAMLQPYIEANTGYLNQAQALQFADLMASRKHWVKEASGWRRVRLEKAELQLSGTEADATLGTTLKLYSDIEEQFASHV